MKCNVFIMLSLCDILENSCKEDTMSLPLLERRGHPGSSTDQVRATADIVRVGLSVQEATGTVSAIEFLKANGIPNAVIQRVLCETAMRAEDKQPV
jgi:hypothetical protein